MPQPYESIGQNVHQETPDKFLCIQCHDAFAISIFIVFPPERDFAVA
jgi:hypothetical protein